jgi:hypothetical protein
LEPSQFWRLTLREIGVVLDGAVARMNRERDDTIVLAWHIEAIARQKKLPPLERLLKPNDQPTGRVMTPDQIQAALRGWFGSRKANR